MKGIKNQIYEKIAVLQSEVKRLTNENMDIRGRLIELEEDLFHFSIMEHRKRHRKRFVMPQGHVYYAMNVMYDKGYNELEIVSDDLKAFLALDEDGIGFGVYNLKNANMSRRFKCHWKLVKFEDIKRGDVVYYGEDKPERYCFIVTVKKDNGISGQEFEPDDNNITEGYISYHKDMKYWKAVPTDEPYEVKE